MGLSNFPADLDTWSTKVDNSTDVDDDHINKLQDAVDALEQKVGKTSSGVITTLDYLLKNVASSNPGHKHTLADGATDITASPSEVNLIDGSVAGTAVASKALVLGGNKNIDTLVVADSGLKLGSGAGTAITATAAELNLIDGSVAGTAVASKALVLGANKEVDTLVVADSGLKLGSGAGTAITATAAELNVLDAATLTDHSLLLGNGAGQPLGSLGVASNGQIPIGSTGADPVLATITQGSGITITNGAGTITIASSYPIGQIVINEPLFTEVSHGGDTNYTTVKTIRAWIPPGATYMRWSGFIKRDSGGAGYARLKISSSYSPEITTVSGTGEWVSSSSGMDVSSFAGTLVAVEIQTKPSYYEYIAYISSVLLYCHTS